MVILYEVGLPLFLAGIDFNFPSARVLVQTLVLLMPSLKYTHKHPINIDHVRLRAAQEITQIKTAHILTTVELH